MLQLLGNLPDEVIGIEASGKVTGDDYQGVLAPAIEEKQREHQKVRLLYLLGPDFEGYTAGALFDDSKLALKHPASWEKVAVVTDDEWVRRSIHWLGWMAPGELKLFEHREEGRAREWISN